MNTNTIVQPSERAESIGRLLGLPSLMHWEGEMREAIKAHETDEFRFYVFSGKPGTALFRFECLSWTPTFELFDIIISFKEQQEKHTLPKLVVDRRLLRKASNMLSGLDTSIDKQEGQQGPLRKPGMLEVWYWLYRHRFSPVIAAV